MQSEPSREKFVRKRKNTKFFTPSDSFKVFVLEWVQPTPFYKKAWLNIHKDTTRSHFSVSISVFFFFLASGLCIISGNVVPLKLKALKRQLIAPLHALFGQTSFWYAYHT